MLSWVIFFEVITATTKSMGMFIPCKDCTLGKAKKGRVSKVAIACSKNLGERLFFDIGSPSTPSCGGQKHWSLVIDDSTNYMWIYFLTEKLDLKSVMMGLIKNFKTEYNIKVQYLCCDNKGENVDFKMACKQEEMGKKF